MQQIKLAFSPVTAQQTCLIAQPSPNFLALEGSPHKKPSWLHLLNVDFSAVPAADAEPFLARDPGIDEDPNAVGYDSDATASDVAWSESDEIDANLTSDAAGMSEGNEEPMMPDVEEEVDDAEFLEGWE